MTTTRSAKAKAVRHQNRVRDDLRQQFPDWTQDDIRRAIMGQAGCDMILSARARRDFSFSIECKATAQGWTPAYDALAQAAANDEHETIGLAIVKQGSARAAGHPPLERFPLDSFAAALVRKWPLQNI